MRVLIVEDSALNAFCLGRLLTVVNKQIQMIVVEDSLSALNHLAGNQIAFVVMDGDLGAAEDKLCNGPYLAEIIWQKNPQLPIIAWTDSDSMRKAFFNVFQKYNKPLNEYTYWTKRISIERIQQSLTYLISESLINPIDNNSANPLLSRLSEKAGIAAKNAECLA